MSIEIGSVAPEFALPDQDYNTRRLSHLLDGSPGGVVVYFFPQADSPGCTREACGFRDLLPEFEARQVRVVGISPDTQTAQAAFASKNSLNFSILADTDHATAEEWGTWRGVGVARMTFVVDAKGFVRHIFPRADVNRHAQDVLALFGGVVAAAPAAAPTPEVPAAAAPSEPAVAAPAAVAPVLSVSAPASSSYPDYVVNSARAALALLLAHLDAGGGLPADLADLAARVAARR